ncbi:hypothetical protein GYMLUDRAFT_174976, partial [Collybiopsis luxurians FD-317 M1]
GDCDTVGHVSIGIHLVINILSTLLLGASNYVIQSLCAPTRSEVEKAHSRGSWLDIGVQSVRNLKHQSRSKRTLWLALFLSSIPLHIFYNSTFFSTLSANIYNIFLAQGPDITQIGNGTNLQLCYFGTGCKSSVYPGELLPLGLGPLPDWDILNPSQCLQAYATDFLSNRNDVIVVIGTNHTEPNGTLWGELGSVFTAYMTIQPGSTSYDWICSDPSRETNWSWTINYAIWSDSTSVNYCISQPAEPRCQLQFNLPLLALVIAFNIVKVVCMALAAIKINDKPLVTVGDAIASFTNNPDPHTRGMCLALPSQLKVQRQKQPITPPLVQYRPQNIRWLNAASRRHWTLTICLFTCAISIVLGLLVFAVLNLRSSDTSGLDALWGLGIGKPHTQTIIRNWAIPAQGYGALIASVLVANSPQLIFSMIYIVFNSLCTTLFLAREWSSYANSRKPLRVSNPEGEQRSTYFLQISYRFGLPLMAYSTVLHWLVSQSIFLVKINYWYGNEPVSYFQRFSRAANISTSCGYSPIGMVLGAVVAASLILIALAISFFRRIDGNIPLVGSCSAAISAACHPPVDGADPLKPMKWGVIWIRTMTGSRVLDISAFRVGKFYRQSLGVTIVDCTISISNRLGAVTVVPLLKLSRIGADIPTEY